MVSKTIDTGSIPVLSAHDIVAKWLNAPDCNSVCPKGCGFDSRRCLSRLSKLKDKLFGYEPNNAGSTPTRDIQAYVV